jgi:hypothetical protein
MPRQPGKRWKLAALAASLLAAVGLCLAPAVASAATTTTEPAIGPVPHGFVATSVTFTSQTRAYVLGTAPCRHRPCTSMVRTTDRGARWLGIPAPRVALGSPYTATGAAVWGTRFANSADGFVFGTQLWETWNGGGKWYRVAAPGSTILSLAISNGQVLALTRPCLPGRCGSTALYRRSLSGGGWRKVANISVGGNEPTDLISTQGRLAAVQNGNKVLLTSNGGRSYVQRNLRCNNPRVMSPSDVAAISSRSVALLCAGNPGAGSSDKALYLSSNLGASWHYAGSPPRGGQPFDLAGVPGHYVVAAISGASWLYHSSTGARWSTAFFAGDGGMGFADLGFTSLSRGAVVRAPVYSNNNSNHAPGWLLLTSSGGASWYRVFF